VFKNGLQTLWLSYLTNYVLTQNIHLSEYFKEFEKENLGIATEEKQKLQQILAALKTEDIEQILKNFKEKQ
jgi:hypothetical protein